MEGAVGRPPHPGLPTDASDHRPARPVLGALSAATSLAGFVPEKAEPKAKGKASQGRVQKGAGGTFTDQLPPMTQLACRRDRFPKDTNKSPRGIVVQDHEKIKNVRILLQ